MWLAPENRTGCHSDLTLAITPRLQLQVGVLIGTGNRRIRVVVYTPPDSTQLPISDG